MLTNHEIWQAVLAELELSISKANFNTWLKSTGILSLQDGQAIICVPSAFAKSWVENKYHKTVVQSLERVTEKPIRRVEYRVGNFKVLSQQAAATPTQPSPTLEFGAATIEEPSYIETPDHTPSSDPFSPPPPEPTPTTTSGSFVLNPKYTFDTFVVGKSSELAYAAAQAVVSRPGVSYNPLFIYGGVGLGKTHLIQAIGNELMKRKPDIAIMYVSAEKFSNDFIGSVKEGTAKQFQDKYRHIDLLLIDDIQFIAGKDRTQESFFHTFNELHQQNKQVVLTSDRPPKAIPALEDRLKSRFGWGMIADIAPPDFETRTAILEKKCAEKNYHLDTLLLQAIASAVQSNIRELEGALNKVIVYHDLKNTEPTAESIKALLLGSAETGGGKTTITAAQVIETVVQMYNLTIDEIVGKSREKKISFPRQIIMYLLRQELGMSFPSIGSELGGRDHTTAIHAYEKIAGEVEQDPKLKQEIDSIKQRLFINNI